VEEHCSAVRDDPVFCHLAKGAGAAPVTGVQAVFAADASAEPPARVSAPDRRVRAIVALAPMAVVFAPASLAAITVPVRVMMAEEDQVLNGKHHGAQVVAHLPKARSSVVAGAGHFAFMAQSGIPLPSAAGDAASNPPGFDRGEFLPQLEEQVLGFFGELWP
jgi:predicted dienelactone hydrolase